jgi:P27 family predicted phage terminase small subunit
MTETLPPPPEHLSEPQRALWVSIVERYALQPEHLAQLQLGLEALDRVAQAREAIERDGLTVTGARGSVTPHPALMVERDSRTAALRALKQLNLDLYGDDSPPRDPKGRFAR